MVIVNYAAFTFKPGMSLHARVLFPSHVTIIRSKWPNLADLYPAFHTLPAIQWLSPVAYTNSKDKMPLAALIVGSPFPLSINSQSPKDAICHSLIYCRLKNTQGAKPSKIANLIRQLLLQVYKNMSISCIYIPPGKIYF